VSASSAIRSTQLTQGLSGRLSVCLSVPELSMGWVDPWVGLVWVGSRFFSFWWVGLGWVNHSKSTKNLNDTMMLFLICVMTFKNTRKYAWLTKSTR